MRVVAIVCGTMAYHVLCDKFEFYNTGAMFDDMPSFRAISADSERRELMPVDTKETLCFSYVRWGKAEVTETGHPVAVLSVNTAVYRSNIVRAIR